MGSLLEDVRWIEIEDIEETLKSDNIPQEIREELIARRDKLLELNKAQRQLHQNIGR